MQTWTHGDDGQWQQWSRPTLALDALASRAASIDQVVVLAQDPADDEQLLAMIRLVRHLAGQAVRVLAGTEHPSASWIAQVREAGADRAYLVCRPGDQTRHPLPPLQDAVELGDDLCPELHLKLARPEPLSVCGRHEDRMVLARHHFDRWCLGRKEDCPHWRGGTRG